MYRKTCLLNSQLHGISNNSGHALDSNPCRPPALKIRFPRWLVWSDSLQGKDASAGFCESWEASASTKVRMLAINRNPL
jgi:hypothetical protein